MVKGLSRKQKKEIKKERIRENASAHRLIFQALKIIGVKYSLGMTMKIAARIVAEAYGLEVAEPTDKLQVARALQPIIRTKTPDRVEQPVIRVRPPPKPPNNAKKLRDFYDSWEWKRLSYDTKKARGRKCECCGAKAPDVRIVTDHIKPIRHHWELRLDVSNLQVLCDDCNMGKGSRDDTDWRLKPQGEKCDPYPGHNPDCEAFAESAVEAHDGSCRPTIR